ncbi:InlB B-repeat-containing protein [Bifidobacterium vespertilionis]|uniref:DUF5648 domain-containing protein n=1 Tax=Bifidobacterium vespertilionis TaxID=2562524 RepID=A0A5J5DXB7_9BIFI|nr:InlB B-repeat-containing protein [Bifidobacterium vespertilionis]KAA8819011.1 hypothetical protein EMO90_08625 [Bifidobacterium vespertilionis]KAA8821453.1 hypothetical protein EM848_10870 [Bifidobacterium vespertilionis]
MPTPPAASALTPAQWAAYATPRGIDASQQNDYVFVGWTYTDSQTKQDLYTGQPIEKNITLYPLYEKYSSVGADNEQNVSVVELDQAGSHSVKVYTLANRPFPEFRADPSLKQDEWQTTDGKKYDFTANVPNVDFDYNDPDLKLLGVNTANANPWHITYDFGENVKGKWVNPTNDGLKETEPTNGYEVEKLVKADDALSLPADPATEGAEFTGWYADGKKVEAGTKISEIPGADAATRTVTVKAGWDQSDNIVPVVFYYGYFDANWSLPNAMEANDSANGANGKVAAKTGKAINYQVKDSAIVPPTGLEDYYQTAAQKDPAVGDFTTRKVVSWNAVKDDAPVTTVTSAIAVYAKWDASFAIRLNANGGFFKNGTNYAYATKSSTQKWQDVVETPTRDGYEFQYWALDRVDGARVNLFDGAGIPESYNPNHVLVAVWKYSGTQQVAAALTAYPLIGELDELGVTIPSFQNKSADYALADKYGFTQDSWKAYVDTLYTLQDEYSAYQHASGQSKFDAADALAPKLEAAQAKLVKANVPSVPGAQKVSVYRLFNPYEKVGTTHLFTTSLDEYNELTAKGWQGEGEVFKATTDEKATPVYRLYNKWDGSHHYTTSVQERDDLVKLGWTYEFVAFYAPADGDATVYRLFNQYNSEHFYTTDKAEYDSLVKIGWTGENEAFKAYAK